MNTERAKYGLRALDIDADLQRAARDRTENMIQYGYFSHSFKRDEVFHPFGTWMRWYYAGSAGEILAYRSADMTAGRAIQMWLGSTGHRAVLLTPWNEMGVELTRGYATVDFGR